MIALRNWADGFPVPLALSSGNHDGNLENGALAAELWECEDRPTAHSLLAANHWMDTLERRGVVSDRRSAILETPSGCAVITTIPFYPAAGTWQFVNELWETGASLRRASNIPWLVLHHEPPADTMVGGKTGDPAVFYKIQEYQPDFVLSGHIHGQPYAGNFADRIGKTWCFNPGVPVISRGIRSKVPNHIVLDLANHTATWHATPNVGHTPILKQISLQ